MARLRHNSETRSSYMALVVLCGYPACGKSTFARALAATLTSRSKNVTIVNDDGTVLTTTNGNPSAPTRDTIYGSTKSEKRYRSSARATAERALDGQTVVILDAPNYVKGYRYELWCMARSHNARYCVVHVTTTASDTGYGAELLQALRARFEAPDAQNRWDCPLHVVDDVSRAATIADAILASQPLNAIGATAKPAVRPDADVMGTLDRYTRAAESGLLAQLRSGLLESGSQLQVEGASRPVVCVRVPRVAELRSMRRALLTLARAHPPSDVSQHAVLDSYVDYVNTQLRGD